MGDFIAISRPPLRELRSKLSPGIAGACLSVFRYLLIEANHSPSQYRGMHLERGQVFRSLQTIARDTGLTFKQVRRAVENLGPGEGQAEGKRGVGEVAYEGANNGTLFTILNYDSYDAFCQSGGQTDGQAEGKRAVGGRATSKEESKEKKEKFKTITLPEVHQRVPCSSAETISSAMGENRVGGNGYLTEAEKAYIRNRPSDQQLEIYDAQDVWDSILGPNIRPPASKLNEMLQIMRDREAYRGDVLKTKFEGILVDTKKRNPNDSVAWIMGGLKRGRYPPRTNTAE